MVSVLDENASDEVEDASAVVVSETSTAWNKGGTSRATGPEGAHNPLGTGGLGAPEGGTGVFGGFTGRGGEVGVVVVLSVVVLTVSMGVEELPAPLDVMEMALVVVLSAADEVIVSAGKRLTRPVELDVAVVPSETVTVEILDIVSTGVDEV